MKLFGQMSRRNHKHKKQKKTYNYTNRNTSNTNTTISKPKPSKISKPEQIYAIAQDIFGGIYYSPGEK